VTKPLVARAAQIAIEEGSSTSTRGRATRLHGPAPAGPCVGFGDAVRSHSGQARHSPDVFELRLRRACRNPAAGVGDRIRPIPDRSGVRTTGHGDHPLDGGAEVAGFGATSTVAIWPHSPANCCGPLTVSAQLHAEAISVQFPGWTACCPVTGCSGPTIGGWVSRSGTQNRRIGRARATRRAPTAISANQAGFIWADPEIDLALVVLTDAISRLGARSLAGDLRRGDIRSHLIGTAH